MSRKYRRHPVKSESELTIPKLDTCITKLSVPDSDFKYVILKYIDDLWQSQSDSQTNKSNAIQPITGPNYRILLAKVEEIKLI